MPIPSTPPRTTIQQVRFPRCPSNSIKNQHAIISRNYERLQAVLASISDAPLCCQNAASSSQSTPLPPGLMIPLSDTSLSTSQSVPWTPALSEPVGDYGTTSIGTPGSEYYSSQLDVLCSSLVLDWSGPYYGIG